MTKASQDCPTKPVRERKDRVTRIRLSETEYRALTSAAKAARLSYSNYVRQCLALKQTQIPPQRQPRLTRQVDPKLLSELARLGNNLNQMARWANTYKRHAEAVEVLVVLLAIEQALADLLRQQKQEAQPYAH